MMEQRTWVNREGRRLSPTPSPIPPHPDELGAAQLPPCEAGISSDKSCPRPATTHYGYSYYCDLHAQWVYAGEAEDEANLAVHHAKRFLWKAQVEGLESLEDHLGRALTALEEHRKKMEQRCDEAGERAGVPRV